MKKLFTILCAGVLSLGVSAQTEAGNMIIGTSSNLTYTSTSAADCDDCDALNNMALSLSYGYFVIDNLALSAGVNFTSMSAGDFSYSTTTIGVNGRYYMSGMFAQAGWATTSMTDMDDAMSTITLGAGYAHMLSDNISLEPMLMYGMNSVGGEASSSVFGIRIGLGCYF
jgi:outer membrane protein W